MFDTLKTYINELTGDAPQRELFEADDYQLAAAALLVHIAAIDGDFDQKEQARLLNIVETRFGLDAANARRLIDDAYASERESVDLYRFTSVLKRRLDEEGRQQVIGMLWDMAYADGVVDEFEENVVWRVAELLGVSTRDRVILRQEAKQEAENDASAEPPSGPWSKN
jgi:uncharacterized tellurite resistance protein B-like protein